MTVSSTAIASMDYVWLGQPFVRTEPKAAAGTQGLDYSFLGQPLVATELAAATSDTEFTTTASATSAFVSTTIAAADASTVITAAVSPIAAATATADAAVAPALTVDWQAQAFATADSTTTAALSVTGVSSAIAGVDFNTALALVVAAQSANVVSSDASTALTLAALWDSVARQTISSDFSTTAALSSTWEPDARQYSVADMQTTLALSTSFAGAHVLPSVFSTVINAPLGPVLTFSIAAGGSGYSLGQQIRLDGGNNDCVMTVLTRGPGNSITLLGVANPGTGYAVGSYTTTRLSGASGTGCVVNVVSVTFNPILWRSGATKGSVWSPAPTLTTTGSALSFAAATSSTTASVTADMVSGATAGSVASTTDSAFADWQGLAIGPVDVDFMAYLTSNVSWSGEAIRRLIVAQLRGVSSSPVALSGSPTIIYLRGD